MGIKSVYAYFTSSFIIPLLGETFQKILLRDLEIIGFNYQQ